MTAFNFHKDEETGVLFVILPGILYQPEPVRKEEFSEDRERPTLCRP